jgi:anaerobic selenocysteine-containing dehydrogenase/Fe-S-cluster-containing dehydrogenase component
VNTENDMENKTEPNQSFVPPRHWVGLEELDAKYWDNPTTLEKRGQEFSEKPVEFIDQLDRSTKGEMARRDFLTIMGASMAMASFSCARRPVHKIIPYVIQPEQIMPGIPLYYASTSKDCPHGCGVLIKTREGRPIKLEGNPDHPVNQGKLCAQGQASILSLYDTDRLKSPRFSGQEISWQEADSAIVSKLKGKRVRVLSGEMKSESTSKLIKEFLSGFTGGEHVQYEPLALDEISEAQTLSYGTAVTPHYRFDQAEVVLSLGSDFLGTDSQAIGNSGAWSKNRKLNAKTAAHAKMSKIYCFESAFTITGANSDERYPVRPGDELKIALAVAYELLISGKKSSLANDSMLAATLSGYKPETVAAEIGLRDGADSIKKVAEELWQNRGRSIVIGGSTHSRTADALSLQLAVNLLNSVLENEGATVDGTLNASTPAPGLSGISKLIHEMSAGSVDALIIYRSNPSYTSPNSGFDAAVKKVPLVVVISDREDETAKLAHYVLPDHHYLENWGDLTPRKGVYSLQQPAISPIHSTRAFEDTLIAWAKGGAGGSSLAKAADWHGYLQNCWKETVFKEVGAMGGFEMFWEGALRSGVVDLKAARMQSGAKPSARSFKSASLSTLPKYRSGSNDLQLALYSNVAMWDGRHANNPWLQELPDPISSATWDNYLAVAPATAEKLAIKNDDVVQVKVGDATVELPVYVQPGLHPSVAAIAIGYGRRSVGSVGDGAGADVYRFTNAQNGRVVFSGQSVSVAKTQKFYKLATTQWHTVSENRPIVNDITLAEFRKNPASSAEVDPELRTETPSLWPVHEYKGYRWGMAIDLNSCTGCGACMIGCQAENNIPVVGRDQVRVSRVMHWIRIDRYYSGTPESPDVIFQPMLCQHCENAPCETVCPVLATVHDDEGLNVQVYNRCVGTRYCQNNCPYKVRRFNFFDHWKSYKDTMNLAWNPDVTVRTRGIMEKCTFCLQRITLAKDSAKDRGEKLKDGEFKTACQQTCPTDAIVFGDMNNPDSQVSKFKADERAFRVLETLNTKPSISYMSKVRNKGDSAHV